MQKIKARITTFHQAFDLIGVTLTEKALGNLRYIQRQGYSERSICYVIWLSQDKIRKFRGDSRFWSVLNNEVRKHALANGDPRWEEVMKRKRALEEYKRDEKRRKEEEKELNRQAKIAQKKEHQKKKDSLCLLLGVDRVKHNKLDSFVYFIQGESGGPIKIGLSCDVKKRLASLQTGHPDNLVVLVDIPGDEVVEAEMHKKFDDCRLRGEWFKPTERLLTFIKSIKKTKLTVVEGGRA